MKFQITIDCDNDAFMEGNKLDPDNTELRRILTKLVRKMKTREVDTFINLCDTNGNPVGKAEMIP